MFQTIASLFAHIVLHNITLLIPMIARLSTDKSSIKVQAAILKLIYYLYISLSILALTKIDKKLNTVTAMSHGIISTFQHKRWCSYTTISIDADKTISTSKQR